MDGPKDKVFSQPPNARGMSQPMSGLFRYAGVAESVGITCNIAT